MSLRHFVQNISISTYLGTNACAVGIIFANAFSVFLVIILKIGEPKMYVKLIGN